MLSDADRAVGGLYGAAKTPDQPYPDFPSRYSFLIDPSGTIRKTYDVKDPAGHAAEVLADLSALRA